MGPCGERQHLSECGPRASSSSFALSRNSTAGLGIVYSSACFAPGPARARPNLAPSPPSLIQAFSCRRAPNADPRVLADTGSARPPRCLWPPISNRKLQKTSNLFGADSAAGRRPFGLFREFFILFAALTSAARSLFPLAPLEANQLRRRVSPRPLAFSALQRAIEKSRPCVRVRHRVPDRSPFIFKPFTYVELRLDPGTLRPSARIQIGPWSISVFRSLGADHAGSPHPPAPWPVRFGHADLLERPVSDGYRPADCWSRGKFPWFSSASRGSASGPSFANPPANRLRRPALRRESGGGAALPPAASTAPATSFGGLVRSANTGQALVDLGLAGLRRGIALPWPARLGLPRLFRLTLPMGLEKAR